MIVRRLRMAVVLGCLVASACEKGPPKDVGIVQTPGGTAPIRLAMVTGAGGLGDAATNASAVAGLNDAKAKLGADTALLQSRSPADYAPNLIALANENYDEVFATSAGMVANVRRVARNYPKRHFAIVDATIDEPNVSSLTFREQDGAFLAGALAAMMTRTHVVGFLGSDVPRSRIMEAGFTAGVRQIAPATRIVARRAASFDDASATRTLARAIYDGRADVLFVGDGDAGRAPFDETRARRNAYAIGVDMTGDALAPGKILTSVLRRVDRAVLSLAEATQSQKLPAGRVEYGVADGGIVLANFAATRGTIGDARIARLAALQSAIDTHRIVPPATREALANYKAIPL